jgi:hypothetical protein
MKSTVGLRAFLVVAVALMLVAGTSRVLAWDSISCGSKTSFVPDNDCKNERCCQCNYQWDIDQCGSDEHCKKGALATLESCQRKAIRTPSASNLHILDQTGGETWQIIFQSPSAGRRTLWALNGNGNGIGDVYAVKDAEIRLNGNVIVDPSRLHEGIDEIRLPIEVKEGPNQIAVTANGPANATLTILVY